MARIEVIANMVSVISGEKREAFQLLADRKPSALILKKKNEDGNYEEEFRVSVGTNNGSINKYGAEFGLATNAAGYAVITAQIPAGIDDVGKFVADKFGSAVVKLNKIEEGIPAALEEVEAEMDAIDALITIH